MTPQPPQTTLVKHRRAAATLLCLLAIAGCANTPGRRSGSLVAGDPLATPTTAVASDTYQAPDTSGPDGGSADGSDAPGSDGSSADTSGADGASGADSGADSSAGTTATDGPTSASSPGYGAGAAPDADEGLARCGGTYSDETSPFGMIFGYSMPAGTYDDPYSVSIDYGDGATAHARSNDFDQIFRHPYRTPGTYTVTASISGAGITSQTDSCTFSWSESVAATGSPQATASSGGGAA